MSGVGVKLRKAMFQYRNRLLENPTMSVQRLEPTFDIKHEAAPSEKRYEDKSTLDNFHGVELRNFRKGNG
jgi:hypothetical protein